MKAAVFLATNVGNQGMYSVDLAARDFFTRNGIPFQLFVTQMPKGRSQKRHGVLTIHLFTGPDSIADCTHLVFWGDFQNNPQYGLQDFAWRDEKIGLSPDRAAGFARWQGIYLHNEALAAGRPVISVGNNFMSMDQIGAERLRRALGDAPYAAFTAIFPRDPVSTQVLLGHVPGLAGRVRTGLDAAFLLDPAGQDMSVDPARHSPCFGHFFHRSGLENPGALVAAIADRTGLRGQKVAPWFEVPQREADESYRSVLHQIRARRLLVSDTYHLCVNALNAGVPVFALARAETAQSGTLGDFKKIVLFDMLDLSDRCLQVEGGRLTDAEIRSIADAVSTPDDCSNEALATRLTAEKQAFEAALLDTLHGPR